MTKRCSVCKDPKSLTEFHRDRSSKDGRQSRCKACMTKYNRKYYRENIERIRAYNREYYRTGGFSSTEPEDALAWVKIVGGDYTLTEADKYCEVCPLDDCYDTDPRCKRSQALRLRVKSDVSGLKGRGLKTSLEEDREIRQRYAAGGTSLRKLGREFGLSGNTVMVIVKHAQERDERRVLWASSVQGG